MTEEKKFTFSPENLRKFEGLLKRYPTTRAALIPSLWLVQEQIGWISQEAMLYLAGLLSIEPSKVLEVITFYTMFHRKPPAKYHIQVCRTLSCNLVGGEAILEHLKKKLGIGIGQSTADGRFSLVEVECLGSCGSGPMFQLNLDYYENLTPGKVDEILDHLE